MGSFQTSLCNQRSFSPMATWQNAKTLQKVFHLQRRDQGRFETSWSTSGRRYRALNPKTRRHKNRPSPLWEIIRHSAPPLALMHTCIYMFFVFSLSSTFLYIFLFVKTEQYLENVEPKEKKSHIQWNLGGRIWLNSDVLQKHGCLTVNRLDKIIILNVNKYKMDTAARGLCKSHRMTFDVSKWPMPFGRRFNMPMLSVLRLKWHWSVCIDAIMH